METLTLSSAVNQSNQRLHVAVAGVLDIHDYSLIEEEQMIKLSDITDFPQEIQEEIVTMPVAKEILLISLVSKEQALYNPKHENYRNTQKKDMKWLEISEHIGWTELQCKAKWKAMRDQYCRELKRSKFNNKVNVKWKYFKELEFLRPYALARNYRPRLPPAINSNNNNNNNNFICTSDNPNGLVNIAADDNSTSKFNTIKIEGTTTLNFTCDFPSIKSDSSNNLTEEQISSVLQQTDDHNWTYITGSNNSSNNNTSLENHSLSDAQHLLTSNHHHHHHNDENQQHQQPTPDEAVLYNVLVDCMGQMQEPPPGQQQQQQHEQQQLCQQQSTTINEDEDEDPIHTFLNIESYFEKELIALVRNEDMLYDNFNPNYRNVKLKLVVWGQIARKLKKTVRQCRLKWKALRDQFIREHKRLKDLNNIEALPKWKHYEALSFLLAFIKHKGDPKPGLTFTSDFDANKNLLQISKTKLEPDSDDGSSSPLQSPLQQMPIVNDDQRLQQQTDHGDNLCVNTATVGDYDDMDIDNYIIGDSGSVVDEHNDPQDNEPETEDRKPQQKFSMFNNHNTNISRDMETATLETDTRTFKEEHTQMQQQHLQEQPINMPSLDLNDATPNTLLNDNNNLTCTPTSTNNNNNSYQHQNLLPNSNNIGLGSGVTTMDMCSASGHMTTLPEPPQPPAPPLHLPPTTLEASTNTHPMQDNMNCSTSNSNPTTNITNTSNVNAVSPEEDEVGAFFKAVAMKIRNANLSQVALTDLEIEILRVINTSLRNH